MEVTVKDGQTLADVAVQECGTWEAAVDIALKNGVSLTGNLAAGTKLLLPDGVTENRVMASYCKAHDVTPATERGGSGVKLRIFGEEFTKEYM